MAPWEVEVRHGRAGALHRESASLVSEGAHRVTRVIDVDAPALVLGSAQRLALVDARATARRAVEVVNRRSGGGAVLVGPGEVVWVDVVVPAGDPLWDDDVGRAAWWLGAVWAEAIERAGCGPAEVWRGPLQHPMTPWSELVCFAGVGPGEVLLGDQKVVGVSQRRTRHGALFQTAALLQWDPGVILELLGVGEAERPTIEAQLRPLARGLGAERSKDLLGALLAALEAHTS